MLISQYAYFELFSPLTSAAETSVPQSRWGGPLPRRAAHRWKIDNDERDRLR